MVEGVGWYRRGSSTHPRHPTAVTLANNAPVPTSGTHDGSYMVKKGIQKVRPVPECCGNPIPCTVW